MDEGKSNAPSKTATGCLSIFGSVFLLLGILTGILASRELLQAWQVQKWVPTSGTLLDISIDTSNSRGSELYKLRGRYRYRFAGEAFESEQIDFARGHDNVGDYHQEQYKKLQPLLNQAEALKVFVNPDDPDEAVVVRALRWGAIVLLGSVCIVFGGTGIFFVGTASISIRRDRQTRKLAALYPGEPWRWEPDWERGELPSGRNPLLWVSVGFAVLWNAATSFVWVMLPAELAAGNRGALVALVFPVGGAALAVWAILEVLRWRRYGGTAFVMRDLPARLGERLLGQVKISSAFPTEEVTLRLSCLKIRIVGRKEKKTRIDVIWEKELVVLLQPGPAGFRLAPVDFLLPADQPPRDVTDPARRVEWCLEAEANVAGPNLKASFDLPVFPNDALDPAQGLDPLDATER
ncbi:MAG: DUF3592 domain-containing protein [Pseudomonadota bacterium]